MNNTHTLKTRTLNSNDDTIIKEKELHDQRTSKWFDTFLKYTNEKSIVGQTIKNYVSQHIDGESEKLVLDIGCGEGELAGYIVEGFQNRFNVNYYGIDNDSSFLLRANELLSGKNVNANFIHGSCFNDDMSKMPYNADLIIGSHLAYYAPNMKAFINTLVSHLSPTGTILLIHGAEHSDQNVLRTNYQAHIDIHTVNNIKSIVEGMPYLKLNAFTIDARMNFPNNSSHFFNDINNSSEVEILQNLNLEKTGDLVNLLELSVQRPLEALADHNLLHDYLNDMHNILANQNNQLHLKDEVQIIKYDNFDSLYKMDIIV